MRNIKFRSPDAAQAQFATAVRKNVGQYFEEKQLSPYANWEVKLKTVVMMAMYIVPFVLFLTVPMSGWVALPLVVVMGFGVAGIGMCVMHDANHGSYSRKKWVNDLMGSTMALLGSNVFNWKMQHNVMHHTYTNIEGLDADIATHGPIRLSEHAPLKKIHRYQYLYAFFLYGLMTLLRFVKDYWLLYTFSKSGLTEAHKRNPYLELLFMTLTKTAYLLLMIGLPLMYSEFALWQVLLGYFIMHWVAGCILGTVFQLAHIVEGAEQPLEKTTGLIENDWIVHELSTTANFAMNNRPLSWYIGGLNFQIEHHLFPHVSHVHYRNIAGIVERTALEYGYPYNNMPTFTDALASHSRRLKELGRIRPSQLPMRG